MTENDLNDLPEPQRIALSELEKTNLRWRFLLILHSFLIVYLAIHNLIVPMILNLAKNQNLLIDVHFWWMIHLPLHYNLRFKKNFSGLIFWMITAGIVARLIIEISLLNQLQSWGFFSIIITELSQVVFITYFIMNYKIPPLNIAAVILGLSLPMIFSHYELRSSWSKIKKTDHIKAVRKINEGGCLKLPYQINLSKISQSPIINEILIKDCGFFQDTILIRKELKVKNESDKNISFRLFVLKSLHPISKWKFKRNFILKSNSSLDLPRDLLTNNDVFLLKSPELPNLGEMMIFNGENFRFFDPVKSYLWDGYNFSEKE